MSERIKVGMANWQLARNQEILVTYGLGSCVGLSLWDDLTRIGAMAHIMLPNSTQMRFRVESNPAKFADTAITVMLEQFDQLGIPRERLQAKLVGGANMFGFYGPDPLDTMNIGQRNITATRAQLQQAGIAVRAEDTGGTAGRSVEFFSATGLLKVRTALQGEREL